MVMSGLMVARAIGIAPRASENGQLHYAFKTLAYTMIDLRHYCHS
jgi:hypothetical protein